jgi:hypothetical protein
MTTDNQTTPIPTADIVYGAQLPTSQQDDWQRQSNGWTITLYFEGRTFTTDFWTGSAITAEPTAQDVLKALIMDHAYSDYSFTEFCDEMGLDTDSRKAHAQFTGLVNQSRRFEKFCGRTGVQGVAELIGLDV